MMDHIGGFHMIFAESITSNDTVEDYSGISFKAVYRLGGILIVLVTAGLWLG